MYPNIPSNDLFINTKPLFILILIKIRVIINKKMYELYAFNYLLYYHRINIK